MKKIIVIIIIATNILILSGCGRTELSVERVAEIAQTLIETESSQFMKNTITNFDDPVVEKVDGYGPGNIKAWKVTFETTLDGLLRPMTLYFDRYTGEFLGADTRE